MARKLSYLILIMMLVSSGCTSQSEPAPTQTIEPTSPTEIPIPTPGPVYKAPVFTPIPDQTLIPGAETTEVDLSDYVYYVDLESDVALWKAEGTEDLSISMDGPRMQINRTTSDWAGTQKVTVEVCNPGDLCGQTEITFNLIGKVENGIMHTQIDGVIIEIGGVKIMIDALFMNQSGTAPIMEEAMRTAAPPYDGVDLVLATHHHWDHFNAGIVVSYLVHNPEARFVSTDVAVQQLARQADFDLVRDRVTAIHLERGESTSLTVGDLDLEVMYFSHGDDENVPNFGYLFTLGGKTFFHIGDIVVDSEPVETLQAYGLPEKGIDYAFVPYFLLTTRTYFPYAVDGINARYLVPVHVSTATKRSGTFFDNLELDFENAVSFRQDYSWYPFPGDE